MNSEGDCFTRENEGLADDSDESLKEVIPTMPLLQGSDLYNHLRKQKKICKPHLCGERIRNKIILHPNQSFLGTQVEHAHQRPGAGVPAKRNGLLQGICRRCPECTGSAQCAPQYSFGVPDTRRDNVRPKVNGSVRKCRFIPQNTFPRNEIGGEALTGMLSVLKSVQILRRYS